MSSVKTAFSSLKYPRPAPIPPVPVPPLPPGVSKGRKRTISEGNLLRGSRQNGELKYDHFAFLKSRGVAIKKGYLGLQRGKLKAWTWTKKSFIVLEERALKAYAKEDGEVLYTLPLEDVNRIERIDARRGFAIWTSKDVWYLLFKEVLSLEQWFQLIRMRCPLLHISNPTGFNHDLHVTYDHAAGAIAGLPEPWLKQIESWNLQAEETEEAQQQQQQQQPVAGPSSAPPSSSSIAAPSTAPSSSTLPSPALTDTAASSWTPALSRSVRSEPSTAATSPTTASSTTGASVASSTKRSSINDTPPYPTRTMAPSIGTSTKNFKDSPQRFKDLDARDLTGVIHPSHLLPTTRDENCDIWKADWNGDFGKRKVAIQVVRLPPLGFPEKVQERLTSMILAEVKALHQLRHPNVVRVRGYALDHGPLPAIISTWLPGGNIVDYLEYKRPIVGKIARLRFLKQAAAGLNYLHSFGREIIHGNFRGIHILINEKGEACITGYGLNPVLAAMDEHSDNEVSATELSPAPRWAPMEAFCKGRSQLTAQSDVFSFARTALEVMTGRHPFDYIQDDAEVVPFVLRGVIPRRPPVFGNDGLWQFLERCWQEDPTKRPTMALVLIRMEEAVSLCEATGDDNSYVPAPKSMSG